MPATMEQLTAFFAAVPVAASTATARVSALRAAHRLTGAMFPVPPAPPMSPVRAGEGWLTAEDAIAGMPVTRYPVGLVGRRDAFLLLLLGPLRLTYGDAQKVTAGSVEVGLDITVAGTVLPRAADAASCWRCVVTRWLRVFGPAALGFRYTVGEILDPTVFTDAHDCDVVAVTDEWRVAPFLLPAIDRHGSLSPHRPLSSRTMATITARRQQAGQAPAVNRAATVPRLADATRSLQEVADGYDDVDARLVVSVSIVQKPDADTVRRLEGQSALS